MTLIAPSSHGTCSTLKLPPEAGEALSFLLLQYFGALTVLVSLMERRIDLFIINRGRRPPQLHQLGSNRPRLLAIQLQFTGDEIALKASRRPRNHGP